MSITNEELDNHAMSQHMKYNSLVSVSLFVKVVLLMYFAHYINLFSLLSKKYKCSDPQISKNMLNNRVQMRQMGLPRFFQIQNHSN